MNPYKFITPLLLLFFIHHGWSQTAIENPDTTMAFIEGIEIIGYQTPIIQDTKRQKRRAKKTIERISIIQYSEKEMSDYDKIKKGIWKVNQNASTDTPVLEHLWRQELAEKIKYPKAVIESGIEEILIIDFQLTDELCIQNPSLVQGENQGLILAVFYAFDEMSTLKLDAKEYEGMRTLRIQISFKIPNKMRPKPTLD